MPDTLLKVKSKVTRLAGAILAESNGEYFLIGELKEPCDFFAHGFKPPLESDPNNRRAYVKLERIGKVICDDDVSLEMETQGEALAQLLFKRFVILRNDSVSNRLWNLVTTHKDGDGAVDGRWLEWIPDEVWEIVRENVLRCL